MPFLDCIVSADGFSPDPSNIDAVDHVSPPTNLTELKSFLGMIGLDTNLIPNLTEIVEPLCELECKDMPYVWTTTQQASSQEAKASISTHLKLALFNQHCATHISVDASNVGLAIQLTQAQGGLEVTVCCTSYMLSKMEWHYPTVETDAHTCICAIEHWDKYLLSKLSRCTQDKQDHMLGGVIVSL